MHEVDKEQTTLEAIHETLKKIEHAQMSTFVQMSRIYDVLALSGMGATPEEILALIEGHKDGIINTATPTLARFDDGFDDDPST